MTNGNLYQIRSDIDALVESAFDAETGEIINEQVFAQLTEATQDEEAAIENMALEYKNAAAWEAMMDAEINVIKKRKELYGKRAERLKNLLLEYLIATQRFKFETINVSLKIRAGRPSVKVDEQFIAWAKQNADELLRYKEPEPDKVKIGARLKNGETVEHAAYVIGAPSLEVK